MLFIQTLKCSKVYKEYEEQGEFRMRQVHESFNIIEDAAIELAGTNYYTGS